MILPLFFMILLYQQAKIQKTDEIIHNHPQFYTLFNNTLPAEFPPIALFLSVYCCATAINSTLTNGSRHLVQLQALPPLYRYLFIMMLPRGENQQLPSGTGNHSHSPRLCQIRKPILLQINQRQPFLKSRPHNGLLTLRNSWRYQNCPLPGRVKSFMKLCLKFFLADASRALHLYLQWPLQQKPIANS